MSIAQDLLEASEIRDREDQVGYLAEMDLRDSQVRRQLFSC